MLSFLHPGCNFMNLIFHLTVNHWWGFRMILYYQLSSPGEPWVGSFFIPFPQGHECPYSLGVWWGEGLTKTTLRHTNGVLPFSESRAFWDTEGENNSDSFMSTYMIIYMEKIKRFQIMGSIYCVETALTWAVPLHGFWCAAPPSAQHTHTHLLFYRTPPVPHLTSPCWGWLAHGRAFNVRHRLSDMWSGKQKGNIQSETSRRQLVRWDWKFPQEVRAGLEQS